MITSDEVWLACLGALFIPEITLGVLLGRVGHPTASAVVIVYGIIKTISRLISASNE